MAVIHGPALEAWTSTNSSRPTYMNQSGNMSAHGYAEAEHSSGDVRVHYEDLIFTSTGGGEWLRLRAIANATGCAAGATINAAHLTGRVASGGTVSGALNAARFTLEVAGTTPTPGGTLASIQLDSNIVTGATLGANDAFCRVTNSGATSFTNLFNIEESSGTGKMYAGYSLKIRCNGASKYIVLSDTENGATSTSTTARVWGTTAAHIASSTAGVIFDDRVHECSATSGNAYGFKQRMYITGAGGSGAAGRFYTLAYGVAAANPYGVEVAMEYHSPTTTVTGLAAAGKFSIIAGVDATGTAAVLDLSYDVASGKTVQTNGSSYIRVGKTNSGTGPNVLFNFVDAAGAAGAVTSLVCTDHANDLTANLFARCLVNGTPAWVMLTTTAPAAS